MNSAAFQHDISRFVIIGCALFLFGVGYNALIAWAERKGYLEGYTACSSPSAGSL